MREVIWLARSRPPEQATIAIAILRCRCRRELYMTFRRSDFGKAFCRGCDEEQGQCYCPSTGEVAA